jgi:hypothetical protein
MQDLKDADSYMPDKAAVAGIEKAIADYNSARPEIYAACRRNSYLAMGGYALLAILVLYASSKMLGNGDGWGLVIGLLIVGGGALYSLIWAPMERHQEALRATLFPKIFSFIDDIRYERKSKPSFLAHVNSLKLASHTDAVNDDLIAGRHDGMAFELLETTLTRGSGRSKETVFKGLIFHCQMDKPFPGFLLAARRGNWFERTMTEMWRTGPTNDLLSGNAQLDETHQFSSDNFAAAQPILAGPLTSVLIWLGNQWPEGEARIALAEAHCYLLLSSKHNYFALPAMSDDISYDWHIRPLIRELVMALAMARAVRSLT